MSIRQGRRYAFLGAGATGKSKTAEYISEIAPSALGFELPMVKSASRLVYEANELTEDKVLAMLPEEQLELQTAIFNQKILNDQNYSFVADRTLLDHYAYCLAYCAGHMSNEIFLQFEEKVRVLMLASYTQIFYFPWGYWFPEKEDGVRSTKLAWQSQIDALMVGYIVRWNLPVIEVPQTLGPDYRNEFVLEAIRGPQSLPEETEAR